MNPTESERQPLPVDTPAPEESPETPETNPVPDDETLIALLEPLKSRYPRLDSEALIASDAFRAYGERVGWDTRELSAGIPTLLDGAKILAQAADPPVPRSTGSASAHRRTLLSPSQQRDLADWNHNNPQYKMSELDYFSALKNN